MPIVLAVLSVFASLLFQQPPDAAILLAQQGQSIGKYRSLQYVFESTYEQKGYKDGKGTIKVVNETAVYFAGPGKLRLERKLDGIQDNIVISDGQFVWIYRPSAKQYMKRSAVLGPAAAFPNGSSGSQNSSFISSRVTKDGALKVDGKERGCWVIEETVRATRPGTHDAAEGITTHCVDKELGISLESSSLIRLDGDLPFNRMEQGDRIRNMKIDRPISESLFVFSPPKDFKEVASLFNVNLPWASLTGSMAPDFELRAADGTLYSSTSLKGKTVLLAFWARSCGPCREALVGLENLYRSRKDEGLVILGIDAEGDPSSTVMSSGDVKASLPTVMGRGSTVLAAFGIKAYPTVVLIDPEGRIVAHNVGLSEITLGTR